MKLRHKLFNLRWLPYTIAACSAVFLYVILTHLDVVGRLVAQIYSYIAPVLYGVICAYLLNPIVHFFSENCLGRMQHRKVARVIGVIVTFLLLFALLTFLFISFIPQLFSSLELLISNMDLYVERIHQALTDWVAQIPFMDLDSNGLLEFADVLQRIAEWLPENFSLILDTSMRIGSGLFNMVIVFFISVYALIDKDNLLKGIKRLGTLFIPQKAYRSLLTFARRCNKIILRYVGSALLDSLIIGVTNFLFMVIFGMPYPLLISVIIGITNLIPTFGPIIGAVIAGIIILIIDPWIVLWFIIWTCVLQTLDSYVIKPLLYGDTMGLPAVWVLVAIIVGGRILGILGVLLAIPVAAICSYLLDKMIEKKQLRNKAPAAETAPPPESDGKELLQDEQHPHD